MVVNCRQDMEHKKVSDKGVLDHVCLSDTLFMLLAVFVSSVD